MTQKNKKTAKLTKKSIFTVPGIISGMLILCSCNAGTETSGIPDSESNSEETAYYTYYHNTFEDVYSAELEIGDKTIPLEIANNIHQYSDVRIKIDGQEVEIDPESKSASLGYAHAETNVYDFTGDGKEDIALIASGGASGTEAVQIFSNTDGQWKEMDLPSDIYGDNGALPEFVQEKLKELNVEMTPLNIYYDSRFISFNDEKILINYRLTADTSKGPTDIGIIQKELFYASNEKNFILGDTLFIPAEN